MSIIVETVFGAPNTPANLPPYECFLFRPQPFFLSISKPVPSSNALENGLVKHWKMVMKEIQTFDGFRGRGNFTVGNSVKDFWTVRVFFHRWHSFK